MQLWCFVACIVTLTLTLVIGSGRKSSSKLQWFQQREFKEKWKPYLSRKNMKSECILRYNREMKIGKRRRIVLQGRNHDELKRHNIIAPQWFCVKSCRASKCFRKAPGAVYLHLYKETIRCICWPALKWRNNKLKKKGPNCQIKKPWRPACNKCRQKGKGKKGKGKKGKGKGGKGGRRGKTGGVMKAPSYTLAQFYDWIEPCLKTGFGGATTAGAAPPTKPAVTATQPPPVTKLPNKQTCQCAADVDRHFGVDIHPTEQAGQWLLRWTDYSKLNINIIGYVIVTEIDSGAGHRHLYYFVKRETTSICISNVPRGHKVQFVVKPWSDTVTLNATTRALFHTVTAMQFTYTPPSFMLISTVHLHSVATHGSVSAQLVYMNQRKDADSIQLYEGAAGASRYQSRFTPAKRNRCMVLMRMQFAMADLGARGYISTCDNASMQVHTEKDSCAGVVTSPPTTRRTTVARRTTTRRPLPPATTTRKPNTKRACNRIKCNFERNMCRWRPHGHKINGDEFKRRTGRYQNMGTGIRYAEEGRSYAASYLWAHDESTMRVQLAAPLTDSIRVAFLYHRAAYDLSVRGCCDAAGERCPWRTPNATGADAKRWKEKEFVCPKGTTAVTFVCATTTSRKLQGACGFDALRCEPAIEKETKKCYGKGLCKRGYKCHYKCRQWSKKMKRYSCATGKCCCYK